MLIARARARGDYYYARGTAHLRQINTALQNLQKRIDLLRQQLSELQKQAERLEMEKKEQLRAVLLDYIVSHELKEVPGIGKALAQDILRNCYDGTLESLSRAYLRVKGVGEKRQQAINRWIAGIRAQLPTLLEQDFPRKKEIINKYCNLSEQLAQAKEALEADLAEYYALLKIVHNNTSWLRAVSSEHFIRAYQGDEKARDLVHRYLIGVFPEWDEPPTWFKRLMKEFG